MKKIELEFKGLLRSPVSWAKVSRKLLVRLADMKNISLKIKPARGFLWTKKIPLPDKLGTLAGNHPNPDCRLMFAYPPRLDNYKSQNQVPLWNLSVYEASRLPPGWAKPLNRFCEQVVVPTTHTRNIYQKSGVRDEKLKVVPYGYDQKLLNKCQENNPGDLTQKNIKIVTLATPHRRKGLDLVAACRKILKDYPVRWHIHAPYRQDEEKTEFWEDPGVLDELKSAGFTVTDNPVGDEKIIRLLSSADLCVQPSRSEGFGLVILEAMAARTPVVTSNWGGHLDFEGPGMMTVDGEMRAAKYCQYDRRQPEARVFEPDIRDLKNKLHHLLTSPGKLKKLGTEAHRTVKHLTWKNSARKLTDLISTRVG